MTDLVRRALLGDREAQEECTRQGIVLPCPFCGAKAEIDVVKKGYKSIISCKTHWCGFLRHSYNNGDTDVNAARRLLSIWNTRQGPPIVRCGECKHWYKEHCTRGPSPCCTLQTPADYYCPYGAKRRAYHETD